MLRLSEVLPPRAILCGCRIPTREALLDELVGAAARAHDWTDGEEIARLVREREAKMTTAIGQGIAVPHARREDRERIAAAVACLPGGIDFQAPDRKPVRLVFLLVSPLAAPGLHVQALAAVSRIPPQVVERLVGAPSPEAFREALVGWEATASR